MKKVISILSVVSVLVFGSCKKGFLDINTDPNRPTSSSPEQLLPNAMNVTANKLNVKLNQLGAIWSGTWAASIDYLWFMDEKLYNVNSNFYVDIWEDLYNDLADLRYAGNAAAKTGKANHQAIAKILEVLHFQILVDMYNNVPYKDALKDVAVLQPSYDKGQDIYDDLIKQLDAAIQLIKTAPAGTPKPGAEDIMLKGDMTKWIKFANTLKLRMLIRQSQLDRDAYIKTEIAKIVTEGTGFLGAGETVYSNPGYSGSKDKQNPFWNAFYKNEGGATKSDYRALRPTVFVINFYKSTNDDRIAQMYLKNGGDYKGVELNAPASKNEYRSENTSAFVVNGGVFKALNQNAVILLSSESLFLQAEAAQRGWLSADAKALYESGIKESFIYLGVPGAAAAAATYYGQTLPNTGYPADASKQLEAIITQKWIALNSISGIEAWNDLRRLDLPKGVPLAIGKTVAPVRLMYPNSELGTNGANVSKENINDPFTQKVFWDK
ncbi:SusD/RagB family nutrient-binding outer membrane lipoprotein [Chitinophaga pendula]|uniref:SusD/RagB family nutrient-binding outer membrane lipoprotein n=1 Tax=Chitinophaga TaxID=79328 RepID=UPI0012FE6656|nr:MULTISPECIES: SusD/RagB family nutrient-binding outer membrane lipoprotein [Chitinophaga]UCJ05242.1 SusD/RagB family nutrient-binding outer membrane lipoprotein [Chitinophaga pendula]